MQNPDRTAAAEARAPCDGAELAVGGGRVSTGRDSDS